MKLAELERLQSNNVRPIIAHAMTVLAPYKAQAVSTNAWYEILRLLYEIVFPASQRAAEISRAHYDAERVRRGLPPHPIPLAELSFERFVKDMDPVRSSIQRVGTVDAQVHEAALRVARSIENSGRWTVMRANQFPDPAFPDRLESIEIPLSELRRERREPANGRAVRGWARVATGAETCGWCWMLVSRGPVYRSEATAGESQNAWHTGCDCKVVPVFDLNNWDGRDRYLAAEELWKEATKGFYGKDAINAYRRAVEAGGIQEILSRSRLAAVA